MTTTTHFTRGKYACSLLGVLVLVAGCTSSSNPADSADSGSKTPSTNVAAPATTTTPPATTPATTQAAATGTAVGLYGDLPVAKVAAPLWKDCQDASAPGLECAVVKMPIDHSAVGKGTYDMHVSRVKAKGTKRGAMLVNPGGPGGEGTKYAASVAQRMPEGVRAAFDIIGFDPRGTGKSSPVDCVDDAFRDASAALDPTPDNAEELEANDQYDVEAACVAKYPDASTYSTIRVAQDMDALSAALGEPKLTYYGVSYGSYLGAVYASAFPSRVGTMVLDGAYLPEASGDEAALVQWGGFNKAFRNWAAWCQKLTTCEFNDSDVTARFVKLVDAIDAKPLKVGNRNVTEGIVASATVASMYSKISWPVLAAAFKQAEDGDGAGLLSLADSFAQRDPATGKYDPLNEANTLINCASGISQPISGEIKTFTQELKDLGPLGRFVSESDWQSICKTPQPAVGYSGDAPVIVIGGENDPATPYSQALTLTAALGDKASLITFTGEGHGGLFDSPCAKDAAEKYYLDGVRPAAGLKCEAAVTAAIPPFLAAIKTPAGFTEVPIDEGASLLGLDPSLFASRTFRVKSGGSAALKKVEQTLVNGGFKVLFSDTIPSLTDSFIGSFQKEPDIALAASFGPAAMASADLQSIAPLAGKGGALVVIAVPINEEALKQLGG
jgi:pimeloyl-ACP methyl ester carboxylesterase